MQLSNAMTPFNRLSSDENLIVVRLADLSELFCLKIFTFLFVNRTGVLDNSCANNLILSKSTKCSEKTKIWSIIASIERDDGPR